MDNNDAVGMLQTLIGTWEGTGAGQFPTMNDFGYREVLEIGGDYEAALLHYKQQTWRLTEGGEAESHTEAGFIGLTDEGTVEITSSQALDRVEVLRGALSPTDSGFSLDVESVSIAHDPRMIRSWRSIVVSADRLSYTMGMATTAVPDGANHLEAELTRAG